MTDSSISKFFEKSRKDRLDIVANFANLSDEDLEILQNDNGGISFDKADKMIENAIQYYVVMEEGEGKEACVKYLNEILRVADKAELISKDLAKNLNQMVERNQIPIQALNGVESVEMTNKQRLDKNVANVKLAETKTRGAALANGKVMEKAKLFKQQAVLSINNLDPKDTKDMIASITNTMEKLSFARDMERGINIKLFDGNGKEVPYNHKDPLNPDYPLTMVRDSRAAGDFPKKHRETNTEPMQIILNNARAAIDMFAKRNDKDSQLPSIKTIEEFNQDIINIIQAASTDIVDGKPPLDVKTRVNQIYKNE